MRYFLLIVLILLYGCDDKKSYKVANQNNTLQEIVNDRYKNLSSVKIEDLKLIPISPAKIITASGVVKDMVYVDNKLYAATDNGSIDIFKDNVLINRILVPSYQDKLYNEKIISTIYSFDTNSDKSIIVCSDETSNKSPYLYQNGKFEKLSINGTIIKVRFVDNEKVIFGLLSNEIVLYDINKKHEIYRTKVSESSFADMQLDHSKRKLAVGVESGILYVLDVLSGNIIETIDNINKDKSFRVDINGNLIFSANQDGSARIFDINKKIYKEFNTHFLVYSGAISPNNDKIIFSINEKNEFVVLDMLNLDRGYLLSGQKSTPNIALFVGDNIIYTSSNDENIMMWKIP